MRQLSSLEIGALVVVGGLLCMLAAGLIYRIAQLLLGTELAQLCLGLAVVIGVGVGFLDYISGRFVKR